MAVQFLFYLSALLIPLATAEDNDELHYLNKVTCGVGCMTGLFILAMVVATAGCFLVCGFCWPAVEYKSRLVRRAAAEKARRGNEQAALSGEDQA